MTFHKLITRSLITAILLAVIFGSHAQTGPDSYATKWKIVDSLVDKKALPASALIQVNAILHLARQQKNQVQIIKALIYRMNLQEINREDAADSSIDELSREITGAPQPARSILESILANAYWNYFQRNRYKIYQRTAVTGVVKNDIGSWGAGEFHKKIGDLYRSSIRDEKNLQSIRLDAYDPILVKGNSRDLRPTLFDLLAHRALDYFKTDERDLNRPAYAFEIDDPVVFSDAATFAGHLFKTTDTASLHFAAVQLFQRLLRSHLADPRPAALLDLDIQRLNFALVYAVTNDKDALYERALTSITDRYGSEPAAAEAWYLLAQQYVNRADRYDPVKDTANRYANLRAKTICEKVLAEKENSEGKVHCSALLQTIQRKSLELSTEKINLPGQPFRSLLSWRNFTRLSIRIISLDRAGRETLGSNYYQDTYWRRLLQLPVLKSFSQDLPATGDYQEHRTEIKIDALPVGEYALVASASPGFELSKNPLAVQFFYVSSIASVNSGSDHFVLNRESGQALARAAVQVWDQVYDYKFSKNVLTRAETYMTDAHGYFFLKDRVNRQGNVQRLLEITSGEDHLFLQDPVGYSDYGSWNGEDNETVEVMETYEKNHLESFLFTDRSIYRPGQIVYFKGIAVTRDYKSRQSKIVTGLTTKLILFDANRTKVDSLLLTSNSYGSYKGQFRLPEGLLNGVFTIRDDSTGSEQSFSVEEYRRPTFFVEYEKLQGVHRVNDTIRIWGGAKAYAGNNIDGATVKYRVLRQARYPWYFALRRPGGRVAGQEIAHGETRTDAAGKFSILFTAQPDRSVSEGSDPVFEYTVSADITDINGETRSGQAVAQAGYKVLELAINPPSEERLPADSLTKLSVRATNLGGEAVPALVDLVIYPLRAPERLIRARYWQQPDQFVMSREDYLRYFPHDEYKDELEPGSWAKGDKVFESRDSAGKILSLPGGSGRKFGPGWYLIEARSTDKYGQAVKTMRYVELYNGQTGRPASPSYDWALENNEPVQPGKKARVEIGSSAADVPVIRKVEGKSGESKSWFQYLTIDNGRQGTEYAVTEADRGGFAVSDIFIRDNRLYKHTHLISVPWTNKELSVRYGTFRDKTLPGSEEKWRIKIEGYQADKVVAEVLAGMYDASLDAFRPHGWSKPNLYPGYYPEKRSWVGETGFAPVSSQFKYENLREPIYFVKQYDALLNMDQGGTIRIRGLATSAAPMSMDRVMMNVETQKGIAMRKEKAEVLQVPDLSSDPDGSRGLISDSVAIQVNMPPAQPAAQPPVQVRRNFNETAFFFPDLRTDSAGNLDLSFTMPEALTKWKMMLLAHTRELALGYSEKTLITQKQLMVQPNMPRFLREGDRMELGFKVANLTDSEMTGQMQLELTDPTTGRTADGQFTNRQPNQFFTVGAGQSAVVNFPIDVPFQYNRPLSYRVVARARDYSDGEEASLPVVSNRMLVTESLPLNMPGDGTKTFKFEKLLQSGSSETLNHHAVTVEFTGNPAWYAIQALPYLMEYPYECAEQTFNRFYANALATKIANSSPRIQEIFQRWKTLDTAALLSNLEKNQELKSVLLQETPWVLQGKSESQQKQHIALLFDMARMSQQLSASIDKLMDLQSPNGGFVWFKGGPDDRYITQYILTGIGHLQQLHALPPAANAKIKAIIASALPYLDRLAKKDYEELLKREKAGSGTPVKTGKPAGGRTPSPVSTDKISPIADLPVQYLYMRSLFPDQGIPGDVLPAISYFRKRAQQSWLQSGKFLQGMIALALYRTGDVYTAKNIMASLKENAIRDAERGMYWKGMEGGYYWYQAPVETAALLIEAFQTISPDAGIDRDCKTWLLKQKQTHNWATTRATADACYALLLGGSDVLTAEKEVTIRLGDKTAGSAGGEAGTGYFKKVFDGPFVNPGMGNITVTMATKTKSEDAHSPTGATIAGTAGSLPAWGAVYWQYFENLDRISPTGGVKAPLKLVKKIFISRNTDRGPVLDPVAENGVLHPGDKVIVRIELQSDRDLEYLHMKDMRAACMEPLNVISGYKWQGGLGYYESTKDVSTDFFFSRVSRGSYVFEYPLFVGQSGNFSNGVTSIECMYAPEFSFHSEGIRVNVENPLP